MVFRTVLRPCIASLVGLLLPVIVAAQSAPTPGTVGAVGGLKFSHALVRENFAGLSPTHSQAASLMPGRVVVETDPAFVRSGKSSIRFSISAGDCGEAIGGGGWNDCDAGNERIELGTDDSFSGKTFHAFSVKLGADFRKLPGGGGRINLMQFYQRKGHPCFNIVYLTDSRRLKVEFRCEGGTYDDAGGNRTAGNVIARDPFAGWNEFVIAANWTKSNDGYFRVLHNGALVYNYSGATLALDDGDAVSDKWFIYRYEGLRRYRAGSTVWFDDIIRSKRLAAIESRYRFSAQELGFR